MYIYTYIYNSNLLDHNIIWQPYHHKRKPAITLELKSISYKNKVYPGQEETFCVYKHSKYTIMFIG